MHKKTPQDIGKRTLRPDEELLWTRVKRTIVPDTPLEENFANLLKSTVSRPLDLQSVKKSQQTPVVKMPSYTPPMQKQENPLNSAPIDDPTAKKLVKGKLSIDARLDLHGMTQIRAHRALYDFVQDCFHAKKRIILVITGKGNMGEGILKSQVPKWIKEPAFTNYVSGYRSSHVTHGGEGALYIRIRKKK